MSYASDSRTLALYDLGAGGTDLRSGVYTLTARGDGSWRRLDPTIRNIFGNVTWCIQRQITTPGAPAAACILEYAAWGETEGANIQVLVGWDADMRPYVGWESGAGQDVRILASHELPRNADVDLAFEREGDRIRIYCNGSLLVEADGCPLPSGGDRSDVELSIGKRITSSSPEMAPTGGWLRFGMWARGPAEIRSEWEEAHPPPAFSPADWSELARQPNVEPYFVFRGSFTSGAAVAWGTRGVHHPDGLIDPRLVDQPTGIVRGVPDSIGAMPERVSATLKIDNRDRALDLLWVGGAEAADEYTGDSIRNLTGKLYLGLVAEDGTIHEEAITPTLCLSGDATMADGVITLPLGSRDETLLGPSRRMVTVGELLNAQVLDAQATYGLAPGDWTDFLGKLSDEIDRDAVVPFCYGRAAFPLAYVGTSIARYFFSFVTPRDPDISRGDAWVIRFKDAGRGETVSARGGRLVWKIQLRVTNAEGLEQDLWLVGFAGSRGLPEQNDGIRLVPIGSVGLPAGVLGNVANITNWLVRDHAEAPTPIDYTSLTRAAARISHAIGITYRSTAKLGEVLAHLSSVGLAFAVTTGDRIVAVPTGWTAADRSAASASLPELHIDEIMEGSWEEVTLVGENVRGASASRVSIEWTQEQREYWPAQTRMDRAPGVSRDALGQEVEHRITGDHIYPPLASRTLALTTARRDVAARRIRVGCQALWPAALELGQLIRVSHPFGAPGGYERRLMRVERVEVMSGDAACRLTLEDLGRYESILTGVLDSWDNWIAQSPTVGQTMTATAGSATLATNFVLPTGAVGHTLWTPAAPDPRDRARRIVARDAGKITVDRPYFGSWTISYGATLPTLDRPWLIMRNHATQGWGFRPDKIRAANEQTGALGDGTTGFRMMMS